MSDLVVTESEIEHCLQQGVNALAAGRPDDAVRWLDRAHRLAPSSPGIAFMMGVALTRTSLADARTRFEAITAEWPDFREAHFALAEATLRLAGARSAAEILSAALHRFSLPPHTDNYHLACEVSQRTAAPGWISLAGDLTLTAFTTPRPRPGRLELAQAGEVLYRRDLASGPAQDFTVALPASVRRPDAIVATVDGTPLLGSGLSPPTLLRVEALVHYPAKGRLRGYAWMPGAPDAVPSLTLRTTGSLDRSVRATGKPVPLDGHPFARVRGFSLSLPVAGLVHVLDSAGRDVPGSPVFPSPMPPPALPSPQPGVDVIIPVFRGAADLRDCLASLRNTLPPNARLVLVDDGSTDRALLALLRKQEAAGALIVLRHAENRGYPAAVNTGLRHAAGRDAVLLNPDTLLPPDWLGRLAAAAYAAPDIGSATPLSNEASIVSYPRARGGNPAPRGEALRRTDRLCRSVNGELVVDLPTTVGFCMYVRADCLAASGGFREDVFAQGYGEENEWCRRSAALGWRHVAAAGLFVSHLGGRSFGPVRAGLLRRNLAALNRLHPGYDSLVQDFLARDPMADARRRLDMARWQRAGSGPLVLLVSHDLGGGVTRFVRDRCDSLHVAGRRTLVVRPEGKGRIVMDAPPDLDCPNLRFRLPQEWPALLAWLRTQHVERVELHHPLNHAPDVETLAGRLGVPLDIYVHDNVFFCPRLTLVGRTGRYCGEPVDTAVCDACIAELGSSIPNAPPVAALRARSRALFATASQIVVPCQDTARRVRRYTGVSPIVRPWQDDAALPPRIRVPAGPVRVAVLGAVNQDKGLDVLLDCARAARARALPIEFVLVGFSSDDTALIEAGIFVTGRFEPEEAISLLRRERATIGFLPSVWPETWCYALTDMWEAGLDVLSFDIGAQGERMRATGRGRLLPLGVPPDRVLATLIAMHTARLE